MPYSFLHLNDATFTANDAVSLNAVNILDHGTAYTIDATQYNGAFSDFWGPLPANASSNVVTVTTNWYNQTFAPSIVTFQYTYADGHTAPAFGGDVVAYNTHDILLDVISGFTPISQAAGTYTGTLDSGDYLVLGDSTQDLSFAANGGNGPNLPLLFAAPEPSTYAVLMVALIAMTIARSPLTRRFLGWFGA